MTDFDNRKETRSGNNDAVSPSSLSMRAGSLSFAPVTVRADALKDGALFDVSEMAQAVGFTYPVGVRKHLWNDVHSAQATDRADATFERLHHVLRLAQAAVQIAPLDAMEVHYRMLLLLAQSPAASGYTIKLIYEIGDLGEPVITLSNPHKDVDLALGEVATTPGALDALVTARVSPMTYLARHARGDWGEVDKEDWAANDRDALSGDGRVLSAYTLPTDDRLWVITEWDRSVTTLLLPEEY